MPFVDRVDAGRRLAERLRHLRGEDVVVLGLPRGGVSVAAEVARALDASLDVIVVRKLGVPSRPELAMGAVGEDGVLVVNERVVRGGHASEVEFAEVERREREEVQRSARRFRGERAGLPLAGRTALVVDDGVATGSTARAACRVARAQGAARVVLAVPVCRRDVAGALGDVVDEVVCLVAPEGFSAVGQFYADFRPTFEREVVELLRRGARRAMSVPADPPPPGGPINEVDGVDGVVDEEVEVVAGRAHLGGYLSVPAGARGLVVFVHGSGSSRHSPRNRYVAGVLQAAGLCDVVVRPAHPAGGARPRHRLRHRAAGRAADRGDVLGGCPSGLPGAAGGVLRGEHGRGGGAVGGRRGPGGGCGRFPRWAAGLGRAPA